MNFFVSGANFCSTCSSPPPPIFTPPSLSSGVVRPINHRASAYHLGVPIACQSSDKMDFQLSQGSQAGFCRMGEQGGFSCSSASPGLLVCYLFFSFHLLQCLAPLLLLSPACSFCLCDLLDRTTWNENTLIMKGQTNTISLPVM